MKKNDNSIIWDRTNIGENYPGVTLPLTYSFVKDAYTKVYENFLKLIGVNEERIQSHRYIMKNMLGYIKGHIFYNIENWYKFLTFLPGYRYNKDFFEAMLNPTKKKEDLPKKRIQLSFIESSVIFLKFIFLLLFFSSLHKKFELKFSELYKEYKKLNLLKMDTFALVSFFEDMENKFFFIWAITIVNDFKVMIFFGLLTKLAERFKNQKENILQDIYNLKKLPRSVLPLKELISITNIINKNEEYRSLFKKKAHEILKRLEKSPNIFLKSKINAYLNEFGERSANELKLEEPKFKEKPELFIGLLKKYSRLDKQSLKDLQSFADNKQKNSKPIKGSIINRFILTVIKSITVEGIYQREYYRIRRGKAFSIARKLFLEMGMRMVQSGDLKNNDDIFYLYKNEVFDYLRYHALKDDFKSTINLRKKTIDRYKLEELPRRITTHGLPNSEKTVNISNSRNFLQGQGTSKGELQAEVIVMISLDFDADYKGKILVTVATDPGWTIIFPLLKGVVTEQGSLLSHASVIARELGIPCIVQVQNATTILKTGQVVKMNSEKGSIAIIN